MHLSSLAALLVLGWWADSVKCVAAVTALDERAFSDEHVTQFLTDYITRHRVTRLLVLTGSLRSEMRDNIWVLRTLLSVN